MVAVRALSRRVAKLELAGRPAPSPFKLIYGPIDDWVDGHIIPDIQRGKLCRRDMVDIVAAVRAWEEAGYFS